MITKVLDLFAAVMCCLAIYYQHENAGTMYEYSQWFFMAIGIVIFALSAVIKDNYIDAAHAVVAFIFGYCVGVVVAIGYLAIILLFRRYWKAQFLVTMSFCLGVFYVF